MNRTPQPNEELILQADPAQTGVVEPKPLPKRGFFSHPITARRWRVFRANKRAYWSLLVLLFLFVLSLVAELIANDEPIIVSYKGKLLFPIVRTYIEKDTFDGGAMESKRLAFPRTDIA